MIKILLVDDDTFFRTLYTSKLIQEGFEVLSAADGEDGLNKAKEIKPNIIILDLIMPKKDGFEVLESLKKDPELNKIPIIIFSTLEQAEDIERVRTMGAYTYINKSQFNFQPLRDTIIKLAGYIK